MGIETVIEVSDRRTYVGSLSAKGEASDTTFVYFGLIPVLVGEIVMKSNPEGGGTVKITEHPGRNSEFIRLGSRDQFPSTTFPTLVFIGTSE